MTQQWQPIANPAGQNRRAARTLLKNWIDGQNIGIDHVYPGEPVEWEYDSYRRSGADFACLVGILIERITETRVADTGPGDFGGKMLHFDVLLEVRHVTFNLDDGAGFSGDTGEIPGEDDADRIADALKDCFRGNGRDLGRPDVVLSVGEYPREDSITSENDPLTIDDGGHVERVCRISFTVTQYLVSSNDPAHP